MVKLEEYKSMPRQRGNAPRPTWKGLIPMCPQDYPIRSDSDNSDVTLREWRPSVYNAGGDGTTSKRKPRRRANLLTTEMKNSILEFQNNRCIYCELTFDSTVYRGYRPRTLKVHWDHFIPYAYVNGHPSNNFVAACSVCNQMKSSKIFDKLSDAREFLAACWKDKGYSIHPRGAPVNIDIRDDFSMAMVSVTPVTRDDDRPAWHAYVYGGKR